jgi:hypothetical protein
MLLDAAAAAVSIAASGHLDKDGMGALPEPIDGNDGVAAAVPYRPAMVPSEAPLIASPARACRHLAVTRALARAPPGWLCPRAAVRRRVLLLMCLVFHVHMDGACNDLPGGRRHSLPQRVPGTLPVSLS